MAGKGNDMKPAVVVFGATGNQGSNVIKHVYALGFADIYAVTRNIHDPRSKQVEFSERVNEGPMHDTGAHWCIFVLNFEHHIISIDAEVSCWRARQLPQVFPGINMLEGDLEDKDSLAAAMRGPRAPGSTRRVLVRK